MNLIYLTTLTTFGVRKERDYPYWEVVELQPRTGPDAWKIICGYRAPSDAINAAEAMEKWELFGERTIIAANGVPGEDLPPHKVSPSGLTEMLPPDL